MEMENRLPGASIAVEHHAIACLRMTPLGGDAGRPPDHVTDQITIGVGHIVQGRDMPARNDQHVKRRLRVDVAERNQSIVLIDD